MNDEILVDEILEWWYRTTPLRERMAETISSIPADEQVRVLDDLTAGRMAWVISVDKAELVRLEVDSRTAAEILDDSLPGFYL